MGILELEKRTTYTWGLWDSRNLLQDILYHASLWFAEGATINPVDMVVKTYSQELLYGEDVTLLNIIRNMYKLPFNSTLKIERLSRTDLGENICQAL